MANSIGSRREETWGGSEINAAREPKSGLAPGGMGDLLGAGLARRQGQPRNDGPQFTTAERAGGSTFWHDSVWHPCLDGKARRIPAESQPVFQRLVDGLPEGMDAVRIASLGFPLAPKIAGRAGILKGYGNAIVPELAAEFIRSYNDR
jgi:DNA (cytosine-5)-methyltransferase 1